ncbi:MATE family efflux transporter [Treponema sp.]|uniref:MATE family efflux transporter n=1 Tax=Treponema sp. TaxID=166 RepID=UPI0025E3A2DB|nr:MATE family efflux transporter [Treponema sp.]MCR5217709.1 MATE family efflux transporter [Treponema sp.]
MSENSVENKTLSVVKLAWPMFVQQLLSMFLGYVDTIMVSHYSDNAVGALGNANQIIGFLLLAFCVISSASGVIISQYLGAGKSGKEMNQIYSLSVAFNIFISLFISIILAFFSRQLLSLIKVPSVMMDDASAYMKIVSLFLFANAAVGIFSQIFNCNGKTFFGMIIMFVMNILNIAGNYMFLYGPLKKLNMGISGVAASTSASNVIGFVLCIFFFYRIIGGRFSLRHFFPFPGKLLAKMIKLGIPAAGESFSYTGSVTVIAVFINMLGPDSVTAKSYCNILTGFSTVFSNAIANAVSIITGHAVGAGRYDYAYKKVLKCLAWAMGITLIIASVNWLISPYTLSLFTQNESIIKIGSSVMLVALFLEIGRVTNYVVIRSMRAAGDILFPVTLGISSMWGISIAASWFFGIFCGFGLAGIWMGMAADEIFRAVVVFIRWQKGSWRGRRVV